MIFIVRDEHNETRDKVSPPHFSAVHLLTPTSDDRQARHEHPHEQAECQ